MPKAKPATPPKRTPATGVGGRGQKREKPQGK